MNQKCLMLNMKLVENNNLKDFTVELLNKYFKHTSILYIFVDIYYFLNDNV